MPDLTGIRMYAYIEPVLTNAGERRSGLAGVLPASEEPVLYGQDEVELSPEARKYQEKISGQAADGASEAEAEQEADIKRVSAEMARREQEVIAHEMSHVAAGGGMTGAVSYTYAMGPDGKRYIVGGEVSIHYSTSGSPEEIIRKMQQLRNAALSPANPSGQDRAVAAQAAQAEAEARAKLTKQSFAEGLESSGGFNRTV